MILKTNKLSKHFGGLRAIDQVDLNVETGEIHAIIGPNGAGKSTLVNLITGVIKPTEGTILFDEQDITNITPRKCVYIGISRTFQNLSLFSNLSVLENVKYGYFSQVKHRNLFSPFVSYTRFKKQERDIEDKAVAILENLGIANWMHEKIADVPYGVQKIAEMARILMADAKILFLDEPAAGLNAVDEEVLKESIFKVAKEGKTVVLIEHSMKMVMSTADRITVINNGKKIAEGTPHAIQSNPTVIEAYLGKSSLGGVQHVGH